MVPLAVAVPAGRVSAARSSSTAVSAGGYVPDGLTAKQWEDMKKKKEVAAAKRKKEVAGKKFEVGLDDCMWYKMRLVREFFW